MNTAVSRPSTLQLAAPAGSLVVVPQNFGELMAFADRMAESNFVPAHLRRKPADCLAVCMQAMRWEMDPFMVAQKTYFVREGSAPGYEAQLIAAVVYARAPLDGRLDVEWSGEMARRVCTVSGRFRGDSKPKVRRVDSSTITTQNSPLWKSDKDQQLAYYTIRAWARLYCPDVIMGVYTPDEIESEGAIDVTPSKPAAQQVQEIITRDPLADFNGDPNPPAAGAPPAGNAGADQQGGGGANNAAPDAGQAAYDATTGEILDAPTLDVPADSASDKIWRAYAVELRDQIQRAPNKRWLEDFQRENHDGMEALRGRSAIAMRAITEALAGRAAELGA